MNLYRRILRAEAMTGSHEANRPSIVIASVVVKPDGWETIQHISSILVHYITVLKLNNLKVLF